MTVGPGARGARGDTHSRCQQVSSSLCRSTKLCPETLDTATRVSRVSKRPEQGREGPGRGRVPEPRGAPHAAHAELAWGARPPPRPRCSAARDARPPPRCLPHGPAPPHPAPSPHAPRAPHARPPNLPWTFPRNDKPPLAAHLSWSRVWPPPTASLGQCTLCRSPLLSSPAFLTRRPQGAERLWPGDHALRTSGLVARSVLSPHLRGRA